MKSSVFLLAFALGLFSIPTNFVNCEIGDIIFPGDNTKYENSECKTSDGFDGICKRSADCPIGRIKPTSQDICSFLKNSAIYCCANEKVSNVQVNGTRPHNATFMLPNTSYNTLSNTMPNNLTNSLANASENTSSNTLPIDETLDVKRPAEATCEYNYPTVDPDCQDFSGDEEPSLSEKFFYMAAIGWTGDNGTVDWRCGGAVISRNFIITSAHCTIYRGARPDIAHPGDLNVSIEEQGVGQHNYNITDIFVHPEYKSPAMYHDIGLLKFTDPEYASYIPACLWLHREIPVNELHGMGYDATLYAGPNQLYQANLTILSNDECSIKVPVSTNLPKGIISHQLCAQDREHKNDTCQASSGGTIQFYEGHGRGKKPMLAGIISFGEYCDGDMPGVYIRISECIDWIESIVWPAGFNVTDFDYYADDDITEPST